MAPGCMEVQKPEIGHCYPYFLGIGNFYIVVELSDKTLKKQATQKSNTIEEMQHDLILKLEISGTGSLYGNKPSHE